MNEHQDYIGVVDASGAGATVWWTLSGSIDLDRLRAAWVAEGQDEKELPVPPSPAAALRAAMMEHKARNRIVRPLDGGWAIKDEHMLEDKSDLDYSPAVVKAKVTIAGTLSMDGDWTLRREIQESYDALLWEIDPARVSSWLSSYVGELGGIALRGTGGIYYLPPWALAKWERLVRVLASAGARHILYDMPTMKSAGAVRAIIDGLTADLQTALDLLDKEMSSGLGEKALETRRIRVEEMQVKLERYETLLGSKLEDIRARIGSAQAAVSAAILAGDSTLAALADVDM